MSANITNDDAYIVDKHNLLCMILMFAYDFSQYSEIHAYQCSIFIYFTASWVRVRKLMSMYYCLRIVSRGELAMMTTMLVMIILKKYVTKVCQSLLSTMKKYIFVCTLYTVDMMYPWAGPLTSWELLMFSFENENGQNEYETCFAWCSTLTFLSEKKTPFTIFQ